MGKRKREPYWHPYYWLYFYYLAMEDDCFVCDIPLCEEWDKDYRAFFEWSVENGYPKWDGKLKNKLKLERIDTSRGYEPGNCRWIVTESGAYYTRDT